MTSVRVPDFLPSTRGFAFANSWPQIPLWELQLGSIAKLSLGDAANGLCGGMSFAAADLHAAGIQPGAGQRPGPGTPRYDYIVRRQIQSFAGLVVPLRLYSLMGTRRPQREPVWAEWLGVTGFDRHSRGWVMVRLEWPRIRAELDGGRLVALTLVRVVSDDPFQMGRNHQVLAYGYELDGNDVTLDLYDPNWPLDDAVTLRFNISDARAAVATTYSKPDPTAVCFFRTPYARSDPVPWR